MTSQQVEQQTKDLIKKIVRDSSASDTKRVIAKLRDIAFHAEVVAQELEGSVK